MEPDISVIIPNYNCASWLSEVIASCFADYDNIEVIVVDDFSTDNSLKILYSLNELYGNKLLVLNNEKKGANNARNLGFKYSRGKFIQWLDADDFILKGKFRNQVREMQSDLSIDIIYSDWILAYYDSERNFKSFKYCKAIETDDYLLALLRNNWVAQHSYLLRRSFASRLHSINAWGTNTLISQDREYYTVAALSGAKFKYLPGFYAQYNKWNAQSVSSGSIKNRSIALWSILNRFDEMIKGNEQFCYNNSYTQVVYTSRLLCAVYEASLRRSFFKLKYHVVDYSEISGFRTTIKCKLLVNFGRVRKLFSRFILHSFVIY